MFFVNKCSLYSGFDIAISSEIYNYLTHTGVCWASLFCSAAPAYRDPRVLVKQIDLHERAINRKKPAGLHFSRFVIAADIVNFHVI